MNEKEKKLLNEIISDIKKKKLRILNISSDEQFWTTGFNKGLDTAILSIRDYFKEKGEKNYEQGQARKN